MFLIMGRTVNPDGHLSSMLTSLSRRQFNDDFSTKIGGGVLVYYVSAQPGKITAFKPVRRTRR